jgi:DNA-binding IclR family transcriptional regulator
VQVLHKTIDILDALRGAPDGMSLAELSAHSRIPKPTVYRILATLESRGYLERASGTSYRISRKLLEAPRESAFEQRLVRAARPTMEKLAALCKETVNLGVLDGGEVLVIETVESQQAVRMSSKIGNRRYPHSTALGKVLLSDLPQREMLRLVRSKGMPKFTPATITREKDLIVELERIRTQGFALDNLENEPDGRCIAAPITNSHGRVIAGLSISGPLPRMTVSRTKLMLRHLAVTCREIASGIA